MLIIVLLLQFTVRPLERALHRATAAATSGKVHLHKHARASLLYFRVREAAREDEATPAEEEQERASYTELSRRTTRSG